MLQIQFFLVEFYRPVVKWLRAALGLSLPGCLGRFTGETNSPGESEIGTVSALAHSYFYQHICKNLLVSLGGIFERTENVWVGTTFDAVNEVADFAEEGVVVREGVCNARPLDLGRSS